MNKGIIFLIDNDKVCTYFLESKIAFPVKVFNTTDRLFQNIREFNPRVIIMDNKMPGRDSVDLVKDIIEEFPGQKVIIITGSWDEKVNEKAIDNGAIFSWWKNGDLSKLARKVNDYLIDTGLLSESMAS